MMTRATLLTCALNEILDAPGDADVFALIRTDCDPPDISLVVRAVVLGDQDEVTLHDEVTTDDGIVVDEIPLPPTTVAALRCRPPAGSHHVVLVGDGWTQFYEIEGYAFPPMSPTRTRGLA